MFFPRQQMGGDLSLSLSHSMDFSAPAEEE